MARSLVMLASLIEIGAGLALFLVPSLAARLLLGQELPEVVAPLVRLGAIGLFALGLAGWPGPARTGLLAYNGLAAIYLGFLGASGVAGPALWALAIVHAAMTLGLIVTGRGSEDR
jgi:hypothetical protein